MSGLRGALPAAEGGPAQAVRAAGAGWRRRGSGPARPGAGVRGGGGAAGGAGEHAALSVALTAPATAHPQAKLYAALLLGRYGQEYKRQLFRTGQSCRKGN